MEESLLIDKISQECTPKITDTVKVNHFIDQNKSWNTGMSNEVLSKYILGKIISIPILIK